MTQREIMECIIIASLLIGNIVAMISLLKMAFIDVVHILKGEAY